MDMHSNYSGGYERAGERKLAGMIPELDGSGYGWRDLEPSASGDARIEAFAGDCLNPLIEKIEEADAVVGCVAWLTNAHILRAMKPGQTQVIVQKEDFLRPDSGRWFKRDLRMRYSRLGTTERMLLPGSAGWLSTSCDPTIQAIRCMGLCPEKRSPSLPRMHHKFLVFCHRQERDLFRAFPDGGFSDDKWEPYAVWTGSFNFTHNATESRENAVYIENAEIARFYAAEYGAMVGLSESLNWESRWVMPEYRMGT